MPNDPTTGEWVACDYVKALRQERRVFRWVWRVEIGLAGLFVVLVGMCVAAADRAEDAAHRADRNRHAMQVEVARLDERLKAIQQSILRIEAKQTQGGSR